MTTSRPGHARAALLVTLLLFAALVTGAPASAPATGSAKRCPASTAHTRATTKCPAVKPKPKHYPKTLVTATMLPGSHTTVEIPALALPGGQTILGTGVTRDIPMSGDISGYITHRWRIGQDIDVNFDHAAFKLDPVDILSDPGCNNSPTLRLNPATIVGIDSTKPSHSVLRYDNTSNATASVLLRLAFDMRTEAGCDKPLVTTGYAETPFTDNLSATLGPHGLLEMHFEGEPTTVSIGVCLYPGAPDKPCSGAVASYPVKITVHAIVRISLKAGK